VDLGSLVGVPDPFGDPSGVQEDLVVGAAGRRPGDKLLSELVT
jgi:hypothetical protein